MAPKKTLKPKGNVHVAAQPKPRRVMINMLPEEVLLELFDFYVDPTRRYDGVEAWCTLVHVCRKWRNIVLESPLRLNLRIRCHPATPVREKLDAWPTSLIVVDQYNKYGHWEPKWGVANIATALEQNNRIRQIDLSRVPTLEMEEILATLMHKSFPVLTELWLHSEDETASVNPDSFLGGSIPCLQILYLAHIPFPGLPNLLFSATHLTNLQLFNISNSGYISPEAMVSCFFALTRLEILILAFESPESFLITEHRPTPPPTRTLLPALTELQFGGVSEYLEDLVIRIDAPLLDNLIIHLFDQFISDTPQLARFINRTPKLKAHNEAHVHFDGVELRLKLGEESEKGLRISYEVEDSRVSSVVQVCTSSLSLAFSANVERLYICDNYSSWRGDIQVENNHWLEFLGLFTSVKSLYLCRVIAPRIAPAFQELIGERIAGVLPALQTLFVEDLDLLRPLPEDIGLFVSRRQFSGHPVAVSHWDGWS
ncbi:hypothetical protein BGY98DRAFT_1144284 [Russula aff. rugulosa BPL654]|nr:hypothetical protein BGY98DRAFT_1144284 [Russula aff. rugulosa BPL654]